MTFTALTLTLTDSTLTHTSADVGKVALFYDVNDVSYFGTIETVVSASSVTLTGSYLPTVDTVVYDIALIESDAVSLSVTSANKNSLANYITDTELKAYAPNLLKYLWASQVSYATQINEAFRLVLDDLRARGVAIRQLGKSIPVTTSSVAGRDAFNRFTVSVSVASSSCVMTLQGSNDETTWESVASVSLSDFTGTTSLVFNSEYAYYKVVITGTAPTYEAWISESYVDRPIIWRALEIIYEQFAKEPNDIWITRKMQAAEYYTNALASVQMLIDSNDSDTVDDEDEVKTTQRTFSR